MIQVLMILLTIAFAIANIVGLIAGVFTFGQVIGLTALCVGVWLIFKFVRFLLEKAEGKTGVSLLLILGMLVIMFFSSQAYVNAYSDGALAKSLKPFYEDGNTAYTSNDWALAEKNYRQALDKKYVSGEKITAKRIADVVNNLSLTLLQEEKNEEAFSLITDAVQSFPEEGGYWMNYLVAAQANDMTASDAIDRISQFTVLEKLATAAEKKPGSNLPLLNGIAYNIMYMDMELGKADSVFADYPDTMLPGNAVYADELNWDKTLSTRYDGYDEILTEMQSKFKKAFGQTDSDLDALADYLNAKQNGAV